MPPNIHLADSDVDNATLCIVARVLSVKADGITATQLAHSIDASTIGFKSADSAALETHAASYFEVAGTGHTEATAHVSAHDGLTTVHAAATTIGGKAIPSAGFEPAGTGHTEAAAHVAAHAGTNTHAQIDTFITSKAAASGLASLNASTKVVEDPANATATPTQNKIPIADGVGGKLAVGWLPTGTGATEVALGNHSHSVTDYSVVKAADEVVNNSATLQDDNHFTGLSIGAGEVWMVKLVLIVTSNASADFKFKLLGSGTGSAQYITTFLPQAGVAWQYWRGSGTDPVVAITVSTALYLDTVEATILLDNTGLLAQTFKLQWAQNSAHVSDTTVSAASCMAAWRIK